MRSEKKQVMVAGQRPSDRSVVLPFLRLGYKLESELDVVLRGAEITRGGRSTPVCLSMFDITQKEHSGRAIAGSLAGYHSLLL